MCDPALRFALLAAFLECSQSLHSNHSRDPIGCANAIQCIEELRGLLLHRLICFISHD